MENIKETLDFIIEHANCDAPACKNCASYKDGGCSFGCVNERVRLTSPNYSCDNFKAIYEFNENTLEALKNIKESMKKLDSDVKNLELFLGGKIDENDFIDLVD